MNMALVHCRECQALVSTEAASCPSCGAPSPAPPQLAHELRPQRPEWSPGDPYPDDLVPLHDPDERGPFGARRLAPYRAGEWVWVDRLETRGFARVLDRSTDFHRGFGTKTYPAWLLEFEDGRREWFSGISIRKLTKAERKQRER
jgi:hypothetical protein